MLPQASSFPNRQELESSLSIRETRGGVFSSFSSLLVVSRGTKVPIQDLKKLSKTGAPAAIYDSNSRSYKLDWKVIDRFLSTIRHELVHFFQCLVCPVMIDNELDRRKVLLLLLQLIKKHCKSKRKVTFPLTLKVEPPLIAFNSFYSPEPITQITTTQILESLAFYHQYMYADPIVADWVIRETVQSFHENNLKKGLYTKLYKSFVSDFGEDAFHLFPLVAWTSILPIKDEKKLYYFAPPVHYIAINEMLFSSKNMRAYFASRIAAGTNTSSIWQEWLDVLRVELGLVVTDIQEEYERTLFETIMTSAEFGHTQNPVYWFPLLQHLERLSSIGFQLMPTLLRLYSDDSYSTVLSHVGWPTLLLETGAIRLIEEHHLEDERKHFDEITACQHGLYFGERFLMRAIGGSVVNECPHLDCPLHKIALCTGHRPYPAKFTECTFPDKVQEYMGLDMNQIRFDESGTNGTIVINLETLKAESF